MKKKELREVIDLCFDCIHKLIDNTNAMGKAINEHLKTHKTITKIEEYTFKCNDNGTLTVNLKLEGGQRTEYTGNLWYIVDMLMINKLHNGYFHPDQAWDGRLTEKQQKLCDEYKNKEESE